MKQTWIRTTCILIILSFYINGTINICFAEALLDSKRGLSILIELEEERLHLIDRDSSKVIKSFIVATGTPATPSPVGTWKVISKGIWSGGFGTRWIGLNVPWGKYGIHGTNKPWSIGTEASHGCIRMHNKDIEELYKYVRHGMVVIIDGGAKGPFKNGLRTLKPGDRGADIYEIQKRMKQIGYYPGTVDGIYNDYMKSYVIKFRKENKLPVSDKIDYRVYRKLGVWPDD